MPEAPQKRVSPKVKIEVRTDTRRDRRKMFRRLPFGALPTVCPCVRDSNDPATVLQAITQRIGVELPKPNPKVVDGIRKFVAQFLKEKVPVLTLSQILSFKEWLDTAPYTIERKRELEAVNDELHGQLPTDKQSATVKCFIKTESYPVVGGVVKPARSIMSRSDFAKVAMGPAFKSIENVIYSLLREDGEPYFIKHVPVPERFKYVKRLVRPGHKYIITDYTAFESSFSREVMLAVECQLYRHCLQNAPQLADYIVKTISGQNSLKFRNGTKVALKARRMSGDMCTSLGNGFTNLMLMEFFCAEAGLTCAGYVEGDDGIFRLGGEIPADFVSRFEDLGFKIKLQEVSDPCLGGFCGIVAADNGNIKDPIRFFQSFGWTHSCIEGGPAVMAGLLRAKALSAVYELPQCPILRAVGERALVLTTGHKARFVDDGYHPCPDLKVPPFAPSVATRSLFCDLYGIAPQMQVELEQRISTADDLAFLEQYLHYDPAFDFVASRFTHC